MTALWQHRDMVTRKHVKGMNNEYLSRVTNGIYILVKENDGGNASGCLNEDSLLLDPASEWSLAIVAWRFLN